MFIRPFQHAFALDFGDNSIKVVQLSKKMGGNFKLNHVSTLPLSEGIIIDGEIQKPEEVLRLLGSHLNNHSPGLIKTPWVVACLPEPKTYVQLIKVAVDPLSGFIEESAVLAEAPSYLPFEMDSVYLDWQPVESGLPKEAEALVSLAAVPKIVADSYTYLLNIAGFTPLALEVEALAIARAVINRNKDLTHEARGILDLGANRSSFIIYDHGIVQFSLTLPISGIKITKMIEERLQVTELEAEKIKKECGLDQRKCQGKLKEVLISVLEDLAAKIFQAVQFYKLHFPENEKLTGIRLCGGGANLPGLENYLSAKLKMKVRRANPWVNLFPVGKEPISLENSLGYTTAIGLAMRALEKPISL